LPTTETEEKLIAAAAIIGESRIPKKGFYCSDPDHIDLPKTSSATG
jgi:hypothetical protein